MGIPNPDTAPPRRMAAPLRGAALAAAAALRRRLAPHPPRPAPRVARAASVSMGSVALGVAWAAYAPAPRADSPLPPPPAAERPASTGDSPDAALDEREALAARVALAERALDRVEASDSAPAQAELDHPPGSTPRASAEQQAEEAEEAEERFDEAELQTSCRQALQRQLAQFSASEARDAALKLEAERERLLEEARLLQHRHAKEHGGEVAQAIEAAKAECDELVEAEKRDRRRQLETQHAEGEVALQHEIADAHESLRVDHAGASSPHSLDTRWAACQTRCFGVRGPRSSGAAARAAAKHGEAAQRAERLSPERAWLSGARTERRLPVGGGAVLERADGDLGAVRPGAEGGGAARGALWRRRRQAAAGGDQPMRRGRCPGAEIGLGRRARDAR